MHIIIGATRGVGRAIATRLTSRNEPVLLSARDLSSLKSFQSELKQLNQSVYIESVDIENSNSVEVFYKNLSTYKSPIRSLIITAAGFYKGSFLDQNIDSIEKLISTTYMGPIRLIYQLLKNLPLCKPCDIILFTSISAATNFDTSKSSVMHISTKAALQNFGVICGKELIPNGVRICSFAPGTFARKERNGIPESVIADWINNIISLPPSVYIETIIMSPTGS